MRDFSVMVYDYNGVLLSELKVSSLRCAWMLNNIGSMEITIPASSATEQVLRFGNFIYFQHETLPAWGGIMWGARRWSAENVVINAYDGLFQFRRRITGAGAIYEGTSRGVLKQLIKDVNQKFDARVREGNLYESLIPFSVTADFTELFDILTQAAEKTRIDFYAEPSIDSQRRMIFNVNTSDYAGGGVDYMFEEGINLRIESANVRDKGNIINAVTITGEGANNDVVLKAYAEDAESIGLYGLTEAAFQTKLDIENANDFQARMRLQRYKRQMATLTANVLDVNNAWAYCFLGARPKLSLYSGGFYGGAVGTFGRRRIEAMQYESDSESVAVTFMERDT